MKKEKRERRKERKERKSIENKKCERGKEKRKRKYEGDEIEKDQRYWISRKKIRKLIESLITRRVRKQKE